MNNTQRRHLRESKIITLRELQALAKFVDDEYINYYESYDEFNATCKKCGKNTIVVDHKKNCVFGIADRVLEQFKGGKQ